VNTVVNDLEATLDGADVNVGGDVSVETKAGVEIRALTFSVGGAGTAAVTGSMTVNTIANRSVASVANATIGSGGLYVRATDEMEDGSAGSSIWSAAGNAGGAGAAAVGAAAASNTVTNTLAATVEASQLSVSETTVVEALEHVEILTASADGAGAGAAAVGGSASVNNIANTVEAGIRDSSNDRTTNNTAISARDESSIDAIAGTIRGAGGVGLGAATSINRIGSTVDTYLSGHQGGAYYDARNVVVNADSAASIRTLAAGVAGGGAGGVAGSVSTNILETEVSAHIDDGAKVRAQNNVGVLAQNEDKIEVAAGAAGIGFGVVGAAGSVVVNLIDSRTLAYISGAGTQVIGLARNADDALSVHNGALKNTPNVGATPDEDSFAWYDLEGAKKNVTGVAVNAFSTQQVGSVAVTGGGSVMGAGIAGTSDVHLLSGETKAYMDGGATVNGDNTGAGAGQDVDILSASHSYVSSFATGAAVGAGGLGGALSSTTIDRATSAYADQAALQASNAVQVRAQSGQGVQALGISLGGGVAGGAGMGVVAILDGTTEAYLEDSTVNSATLDVAAESRSGVNLVGGSAAAGAGTVGAAVAVAISDSTTRAAIYGGAVNVDGRVAVEAGSVTDFWNLAVSGSVAGIGFNGMAAVNIVGNTTEAIVSGADIEAGSATVAAEDEVNVRSYGGALTAGLNALGAAADVTVVQSRVAAEVLNSTLDVANALQVSAASDVDVEHVAASAGLGIGAGLSGSASLILLGNGSSGEAMAELDKGGNGILSRVYELSEGDKLSHANADGLSADQKQAFADVDNNENVLASRGHFENGGLDRVGDVAESLTSAEADRVNTAAGYDVEKHFENGDADVTRAGISGGQIVAGSVEVEAIDRTRTSNLAGAASLGLGTLGVGGGVAITRVYNDVQAVLAANSLGTGSASVTARALDGDGTAAHALGVAGGAGPVGLGAAWADAYVENAVLANVGGVMIVNDDPDNPDDTVSVYAEDATSAIAESMGAAAGAGAVGVSVAMAEKSSAVSAVAGGTLAGADALDVAALSRGGVQSKSTAASGGLAAAGTGAGADAFDRSVVRAYVAANANVDADALNVEATAKPQTRAEALGVAVSAGIGIGASVAKAESETDVAAYIGNGARIVTESLGVVAGSVRPDSGQTAYAKAIGGSGGFLFGANATVADAASTNTVLSYVHKGATVTTAGSVSVSASNTSEQDAEAFGIAAGLVAVGANIANARSNSTVEARFDGKLEGMPMVRVYDYVNQEYVYIPLAEFAGDTADAQLRIFTDSEGVQWVQYQEPVSGKYRYATLAAYNIANPMPDNEDNTGKPVEEHVAPDGYKHPVMVFVTQDLKVTAAGEDDNYAKAIAGSGGVVAGHAATAGTTNNSRTIASLQNEGSPDTIRASNVVVDAAHIARFNAEVDSVNAAVLGASGAMARHTVNTDTDAVIGAGAKIEAHDVTVKATDTIRKDWLSDYNVRAAGGGVVSGAAAGSVTNVTQSTDAIVGTGAALKVVGSRNVDHNFDIAAINDFEIRDKVKLDTGGRSTSR